jgi:hypothetical protein
LTDWYAASRQQAGCRLQISCFQKAVFKTFSDVCIFLVSDEHGEWMDQPFDVVEDEKYIGPDYGDIVPEYGGDGAKMAPGSFEESARQLVDWSFPEHGEKPVERADFGSKEDGQVVVSGGRWVDKRKSNK